jgi:RimJ/RimL family protein N-acetyltransferase
MDFRLVAGAPDGFPEESDLVLPVFAHESCALSAAWYARVGYVPPWVGYFAVTAGITVGGGGFKEAPKNGRVEIAYFTVPEFEGRGFASRTARALVAIARQADAGLIITAQTLPVENASTAILRKLGFRLDRTIDHPQDGEVWEWLT